MGPVGCELGVVLGVAELEVGKVCALEMLCGLCIADCRVASWLVNRFCRWEMARGWGYPHRDVRCWDERYLMCCCC